MGRPKRPEYVFKLELDIRARLQGEICSLAMCKPLYDVQQDSLASEVLPCVPPLQY